MAETKYVARLKAKYDSEVVTKLLETYKYGSVMEVPHIEKVVINVDVGDATSNSKLLDDAVRDLTIISGQKPVITKAKKSIASFKLREGQAIGFDKVTKIRGMDIVIVTTANSDKEAFTLLEALGMPFHK